MFPKFVASIPECLLRQSSVLVSTNVQKVKEFPMFFLLLHILPSIAPSQGCGPFRNKKYMWDVIGETVDKLPPFLDDVIGIILAPAIGVPIIVILM